MIAIPNMDKPKNCKVCPFTCEKLAFFDGKNIPQGCPLIDIVTCGECKWSYIDEKYEGTLWCKVHFHHYRVNSDGFCNYGERRKDGI